MTRMLNMNKHSLYIITFLLGLLTCLPAAALEETAIQGAAPVKLKAGSVAPSGTPWAAMFDEISGIVSSESKQAIKLEVGYGGAFGGESELLQKCAEGKIAMVGVSSTIASEVVPELGIIELPYLFRNFEEADYILDEVLFPIMAEKLAQKDLLLLMWAENGYKNLATIRNVRKPADLRGMRIRCQKSPVYYQIFKNYGADPVALSIREVARALQSGVLEGFDNTPLFTYSSGLYRYIKSYTLTEHTYQPILFLMSRKVFDGLSPEQKSIFVKSIPAKAAGFRGAVRLSMQNMLEKLRENGIEIIQLSQAEKEAFRISAQSVYSRGNLLGGESKKLFENVLKALTEYRKRNISN